jgi:hypothetical protein
MNRIEAETEEVIYSSDDDNILGISEERHA